MSKRADMFVDPAHDPRETGPLLGDERTTLLDYLRYQRLTLEIKCEGLDAEQLARRSVEPSTMSLLGPGPASRRGRAELVPADDVR
jgi:hypothetical protein